MSDTKQRPTEAEFDELKRRRDEAVEKMVEEVCQEKGWPRAEVHVHASHAGDECYCACPDGPCQHTWDGPNYESEDGCMMSVTCSRCSAVAAYHDMRVGP